METHGLLWLEIMAVTEIHLEILISACIVDMCRTVHVAYKMNEILEVHAYCRIGLLLIVLEQFDSLLDSIDGVAFSPCRSIFKIFIHDGNMPCSGEAVLLGVTILVHPLREIYDRVVSEILLDCLLCRWLQVILGNLGNDLVAFPAPAGRCSASHHGRKNDKCYLLHIQ